MASELENLFAITKGQPDLRELLDNLEEINRVYAQSLAAGGGRQPVSAEMTLSIDPDLVDRSDSSTRHGAL